MGILVHFKKLDWIMIISVFLLCAIGFVSLYSISLGRGEFSNFKKQIMFFVVGFFLMILISFFDWRALRDDSYLILILYFISILGLLGLLFFAPEIRGAKSWYKIGQFSLDPIEFVKIILIILMAKYFSMRHIEMYKIKHIILSGLYFLIPIIPIFLQPNLGPVLLLILLWVGVLIISGIKIRHFLLLCFFWVLILILGWFFLLKDYQKDRIISFIAPQIEPLGTGWSQNQAKIAIGSGGIWGKGFGRGSQAQYGFLPEPQTDFIFAAIAEEFGLIGIIILLSLFLIFLWRCVKIAIISQKNFARLFVAGFSIIFVFNIFIHIGMNLGILPIIGIPLPLVSYGGSSLISLFIGIGILQSIKTKP